MSQKIHCYWCGSTDDIVIRDGTAYCIKDAPNPNLEQDWKIRRRQRNET